MPLKKITYIEKIQRISNHNKKGIFFIILFCIFKEQMLYMLYITKNRT
jgi:hypothetical protein